ncbi:MAG: hypothetical protein GXX85_10040 [Ignavibacteria bacterium]|nr:hypothetical protein [Ignavibacteria bacterium]
MKNRKMFILSLSIIIAALAVMGINLFAVQFSDNIHRITGFILAAGLVLLGYSTAKIYIKS